MRERGGREGREEEESEGERREGGEGYIVGLCIYIGVYCYYTSDYIVCVPTVLLYTGVYTCV